MWSSEAEGRCVSFPGMKFIPPSRVKFWLLLLLVLLTAAMYWISAALVTSICDHTILQCNSIGAQIPEMDLIELK